CFSTNSRDKLEKRGKTGDHFPLSGLGRIGGSPSRIASGGSTAGGGSPIVLVASMNRDTKPMAANTAAHVMKSASYPAFLDANMPVNGNNMSGETKAPRLPHMLPQPRTTPTLRLPTSRL